MRPGKKVVGFAGGGGSSTGVKKALGCDPDIAINHSKWAIAMHQANHPRTLHINSNIYRVDPRDVVGREHVAFGWFSPDCKDFSKAKGGTPVRRNIRDLAWVVDMWADRTDMELFFLENVEEFEFWGPTYFEDGKEYPDPERRGETFKLFNRRLRRRGFKRIEWRLLRGCNYGDPTIRQRLFMIGRRDDQPIVWPAPTHGAPDDPDVIAGRKLPWRIAGDFIDWSIPCPSIFMTRDEAREFYRLTGIRTRRPLADATMDRLAVGLRRYVLENPSPYEVPHDDVVKALAWIAQHNLGAVGHDMRKPLSTIMGSGSHQQVVQAFISYAQQGGANRAATIPHHTLCASQKDQNQVVAAYMLNLKGSDRRDASMANPSPTICAEGGHLAAVQAFMVKYYGEGGQWQGCDEPMHTDTTKPRMGVVQVQGEQRILTDIGMRMLTIRERFNMQGFPPDYIIDVEIDGKKITLEQQGICCGNAVNPGVASALVAANAPELIEERVAA